jgi:hypothetical protein
MRSDLDAEGEIIMLRIQFYGRGGQGMKIASRMFGLRASTEGMIPKMPYRGRAPWCPRGSIHQDR